MCYWVLALCFMMIQAGCAGSPLEGYKTGAEEEQAIRKALASYEKAWNAHDPSKLLDLLHEDFVIFAGSDRRIVYTKARYAFELRDIMRKYRYVNLGEVTVWVKGPKAIVYAPMQVDGKPVTNRFHMIRENGTWLFLDSEF